MKKRLPVRRSVLAVWSRIIGTLSIPVLILAVLAHRADLMDASHMELTLLAGSILGGIAVLGALIALTILWRRGGSGGLSAIQGLICGLLTVSPAVAYGVGNLVIPNLPDVSTDIVTPPVIRTAGGIPVPWRLSEAEIQKETYPDLSPRRFRIEPADLDHAVQAVINKHGWRIVDRWPPEFPDSPIWVQVEVTSPVLGLKDDLAVRIRPDTVGAIIDVRSISRHDRSELGATVRRVRSFYSDLDDALVASYGSLEKVLVSEIEPWQSGPDVSIIDEVRPELVHRGRGDRLPLPLGKPNAGASGVSGR